MHSARWLHIPMEIVDRELYPKLLLASHATDQGWNCILGTKKSLVRAAAHLPPGIIYLKSVIPSEINNMRTYKKHGHSLVCLDEEGLVQTSLDILTTGRYCPETVAETEKFFCWGRVQREALEKEYGAHAGKFTETGSPTADLWTLKAGEVFGEQAAALQKRFGKFIFIPSSFGVPNHFMGPEASIGIMQRDNMVRDQAEYDYYKKYNDFTLKVFHDFIAMVPVVAKAFPDHKIIIRPHPSERHETWHEIARDMKNVQVIYEGTVSPWLLGAEAVLHWGSTTGIEAHLMNRPVIAYAPPYREQEDFDNLPHTVSIKAQTQDEVVAALTEIFANPQGWKNRYPEVAEGHETIKEWIFNIANPPAVENIMAGLCAINMPAAPLAAKIDVGEKLAPKEIVWRILDRLGRNKALYTLFPARIKLGFQSRAYGRQKVRGLSHADVRDALGRLDANPARVEELGRELFLITKQPVSR